MNDNISELKKKWNWEKTILPATDEEIKSFESLNGLLIPKDLTNYFKLVNGTDGYDEGFFQFYPLNLFQPFDLNKSLHVFADYQCKLFLYVIRLHEVERKSNEVFIFCGNDYKFLCNSFTEFVDLCLNDSQKLFFND